TAYPNQVALNGGLHLLLGILDGLYDVAGFLDGDALLHGDLLSYGGPGRRLDRTIGQAFERHASLDQLLLQNVGDRFQFVFVDGTKDERVFALHLDIRFRVLQIETGMDFFDRLLDGITDLLQVDLADNVKSILWHDLID